MKNWISVLISAIVFFGVNVLLDYLFEKNINWIVTIISTIIFIILESIILVFKKKD